MNRKFTTALATMAVVFSAGVLGAQTYTLSVSGPASAEFGTSFDAAVLLDFDDPTNMAGWSYGVCNDTAFITCDASADGSTTNTANNGAPAGFIQGNVFPEGYTKGIVIDLLGAASLPAGTGYELSIGSYTAGTTAGMTDLAFCNTLGTPPVDTVVVINGQSITPTQVAATVEVTEPPPIPDPAFTFIAPTADGGTYITADGIGGNTYNLQFSVAEADQSADGLAFPSATQGFSFAASNDPALLTPTAVTGVGALAALNGGSGPDFFQVGLFADAWSAGVVYVLTGGETIGFSTGGDAVVEVAYEGVAGALVGVLGSSTTPIVWNNNVGTPAVSLVVVVDGASYAAALTDGSLTLEGIENTPFRRGDANDDGIVNIADIIRNLDQQFNGAPVTCLWASDANDDGLHTIADPIYTASYVFLAGAPPAAPFPDCGFDAVQSPTDCVTYNSCP